MMPIHTTCLEDHVDTLMTVQILQQFCEGKQKYGLLHKQSHFNYSTVPLKR